jgi:hypothetical protein
MAQVLFHTELSSDQIAECTIWAALWAWGLETSVGPVDDREIHTVVRYTFMKFGIEPTRAEARAVHAGAKELITDKPFLWELSSSIARSLAAGGQPRIPDELKGRAAWAVPIVPPREEEEGVAAETDRSLLPAIAVAPLAPSPAQAFGLGPSLSPRGEGRDDGRRRGVVTERP